MDLGDWLRSLGLGQYEAVFRQNDIDETVLPNLTAEDLKELGVAALGHRRKLLDAIAALRAVADRKAPSAGAATSSAPNSSPERLNELSCDLNHPEVDIIAEHRGAGRLGWTNRTAQAKMIWRIRTFADGSA
jgi:hypothetical protein